jgi:mono/diheme cytochrome c family protein
MQMMRLTIACLATIALAGSVSAQKTDIGAQLCAACHGAAGLGDEDMADVVNAPPPNLTLLARNNDGVFPMLGSCT